MWDNTDNRQIPGCIAKHEPDAAFGWMSDRRLVVIKGEQTTSLSADDLKSLFRFIEANHIEEQV